ncbi:spore germination protein [Pueribacillus theae]|uniref:Spore germination protein n=1 Tax=Pueribacillus theae TaxID=2171751 RepID=A0A2U1K3Y5_9BACI|nr:spore germination protein [Pueribacillus theae]PWA12240.1 spore germination protein [Pueribacillus theae]
MFKKKLKTTVKKKNGNESKQQDEKKEKNPISHSLIKNIERIKQITGNSNDIVIREFRAGVEQNIHLAIVYTDGLADEDFIHNYILESLMLNIRESKLNRTDAKIFHPVDFIASAFLTVGDLKSVDDFDTALNHILSGNTIILIDGSHSCFACDTRGWNDRSIEEPSAQTVIRGPKDSFTETLRTNTALIRRRVKDPNLRIEGKVIGKRTKTDVSIVYIKGIADSKVVEEVHKRLDRINIDSILESGYIEELIEDGTYSPFPTVYHTERPDSTAASLLEGRVAILVDGTPFVLLVPAIFMQFLQSAEDYYQRFDIGTFIRLLRHITFFLALLTPAVYIAVTTFHQEMLPTQLLVSLAAQREAIPFPAIVEAVLMEVTFEILREAGVRMPRAVGPAISIVGALVLGEAAVNAGLVSSAMVIVVSITAIASFVFPAYNLAIAVRILRFLFMLLASMFGLFGIILGLIVMVLHLCSLRSFGVPYLSPLGPYYKKDIKDTAVRFPWWAMTTRPYLIGKNNLNREDSPPPKPPKNRGN